MIDSYPVQDKTQIADLDPSMIIDEEFDDDLFDDSVDITPCLVCESYGSEENLLLCDGCDGSCHTYCDGLDSVPPGKWFCRFCRQEGLHLRSSTSFRRGRNRLRIQPNQPRPHSRRQRENTSIEWSRVWRSIFYRTNLDLDFPFDDLVDDSSAQRNAQRREFQQWRQRFDIAERQGGAARFRDTASALLSTRNARQRDATPKPESQDEIRAWNAFDKAMELQGEPSTRPSGRNKRKSPSPLPTEGQEAEPERKLKRPRNRRMQILDEASAESGTESSDHAQTHMVSGSRLRPITEAASPPLQADSSNAAGPSFLQSLLKEVEKAPTPTDITSRGRDGLSISIFDSSLPNSPSPFPSPTSSNHPSPRPRSASPPPFKRSRPVSPPLTSRVDPIYPHWPLSPTIRPQSDSERDVEPPKRHKRYVSFSSHPCSYTRASS